MNDREKSNRQLWAKYQQAPRLASLLWYMIAKEQLQLLAKVTFIISNLLNFQSCTSMKLTGDLAIVPCDGFQRKQLSLLSMRGAFSANL